MYFFSKKTCNNFSNLDILEKLSVLEKLILNNIFKKSANKSFNKFNESNSFKLLLEIIKLQHKIKSNNNKDEILNLFNDIYINTKNNINEITTNE